MVRRALAILLGIGIPAAPVRAELQVSSWQLDPVPLHSDGASAVAMAPDGRWAVGDARGVLVRSRGGSWQRFGLHGGVRDLAFAPDGALWVASDQGLLRFDGERVEARDPAPGEASGGVLRLAISGPLLAVSTEGGVHWSRDGRRFERVDGPLGEAPASGLAWQQPTEVESSATLWIAGERGLLRARLSREGALARATGEQVELPVDARPALDVRSGPHGILVLGERVLAAGDGSGAHWRTHPLKLPPAALATRLLDGPGAIWIATDGGLLEASGPAGPWRRAAPPAGATPTAALAFDGDRLLAASARGLLVGRLEDAVPTRSAAPAGTAVPAVRAAPPGACDPPIQDVHRVVLARLDLGGERVARMWWGVRRRALLPLVTFEGTLGTSDGHKRSWNQSFVSGGTHDLFDRDLDAENKREVSLKLIWDLGATLFDDQEIDVSTEARRVIALRDDVLDEVNQLYFDRRRALEAAAAAPPESPEAARERLRADELAAGLDGWTREWFGAHAGACPPGSR